VIEYLRKQANRTRALALIAPLVIVLGLALLPLVKSLVTLPQRDPAASQRLLVDFGRQLSRIAADKQPVFGMLSSVMDANILLLTTRIPQVTGPFGTPEALSRNRVGFRILLSKDPAFARRSLEENKIRYLVLSSIITHIGAMARVAGIADDFTIEDKQAAGRDVKISIRPLPPFFASLHTRLLFADGSQLTVGENTYPALSDFRLILESQAQTEMFGRPVPVYKAFEMVPGARLKGPAQPDQEVRLRLMVQTNIGRRFMYQAQTTADDQGQFEFILPYPAYEGAQTPCHAVSPYMIKIGDSVHKVTVSSQAVTSGESVVLEVPAK
jgi:hypothetical protein